MKHYNAVKKGRFVFFMMFFYVIICQGQYYYLGLGHSRTTDLYIFGDSIYAGTYDGIFKKNVISLDTNWIPCGMQGNHIVQIVAVDHSTFIAVIEIGNTKKTRIHKSANGGNTFSLLLPDTSVVNNYQHLDHIAYSGNTLDTLYSLFHKKKTFDGGISWLPINYFSIRFIKAHPVFHNQVFMGGETMIFSAELKCSYDYANSFTSVSMNGYFYGDNSVHDIEFIGNRWIAVGEGVISYTDDKGNTWNQAINTWSYPQPWAMYILDIEKSIDNTLYASGESGTANKVGFFISYDSGTSWDTVSFNSFHNSNPSIKCITLFCDNNYDNLFLGGNGVYLFRNAVSGIKNPNNTDISFSIYPNPSITGRFFINNLDNNVIIDSWSVSNLLGEVIISGHDNNFTLDTGGAYFLKINTNKGIVIKKIMKMK